MVNRGNGDPTIRTCLRRRLRLENRLNRATTTGRSAYEAGTHFRNNLARLERVITLLGCEQHKPLSLSCGPKAWYGLDPALHRKHYLGQGSLCGDSLLPHDRHQHPVAWRELERLLPVVAEELPTSAPRLGA